MGDGFWKNDDRSSILMSSALKILQKLKWTQNNIIRAILREKFGPNNIKSYKAETQGQKIK
jgi:hypothetical protein